jgi:hypothetical protein
MKSEENRQRNQYQNISYNISYNDIISEPFLTHIFTVTLFNYHNPHSLSLSHFHSFPLHSSSLVCPFCNILWLHFNNNNYYYYLQQEYNYIL